LFKKKKKEYVLFSKDGQDNPYWFWGIYCEILIQNKNSIEGGYVLADMRMFKAYRIPSVSTEFFFPNFLNLFLAF
jgi:hypothetical protein